MLFLVAVLAALPSGPAVPSAARVGPSPIKQWEQWTVTRKDAPALDVFVAGHAEKRPLVVLVQGSWCLPLFMLSPKREVSTLPLREAIPIETKRVAIAVV